MVTRSGGAMLRAAVGGGTGGGAGGPLPGHSGVVSGHAEAAHPETVSGPTISFIGNAEAAKPWEELDALSQPGAWAEEANARKKAYGRHARVHHPDRSTGSQERFQLLAFLYKRANHHYDPSSEPDFVNEL